MPSRSATPGRNASISTSADLIIARSTSRPLGCLRSMAIDRRLRKSGDTPGVAASPPSRSTRMTSAPMSANIMHRKGAPPSPATSMILTPDKGPLTSFTRQFTLVQPQASADDFLHDLGGAREDTHHPRIGVQTRDAILLHVAGAAVQLHAGIDDAAGELGGQQFRLGGEFGGQSPLVVLEHQLID